MHRADHDIIHITKPAATCETSSLTATMQSMLTQKEHPDHNDVPAGVSRRKPCSCEYHFRGDSDSGAVPHLKWLMLIDILGLRLVKQSRPI